MDATGKCLCEAVTFTAEDVDTGVHTCHCSICRRWTGGPAFAVSVGAVTFTGAENLGRFDSSDWAERGYCSRCGTNMYYRLKDADKYMLWMGTFDDQEPFKLASEIFIDEKPGSYDLSGEHLRMTGAEFMASVQQSGV